MSDPIVQVLSIVMVGQISLSVPLLISRFSANATFIPLAVFLLACGLLAMNSIAATLFDSTYLIYTALVFPTLFVLCPSLWFYIEGITSNTPWKFTKKHALHGVLVIPALVVSVMILTLPNDVHRAIFIDDITANHPLVGTLFSTMLIMMVLWLLQCVYTLYCITRRLNDYRKELKNVFSNNENKELKWVNWLLFSALCAWLFSLITLFASSLFNNVLFTARVEAFLSLLLLWSLAYFGLQQKPALIGEGAYWLGDSKTEIKDQPNQKQHQDDSHQQKYQRSALSQAQSVRIAEKINTAMENEQLYLDSSLSLQKLAKHTAISPNYISQTLNETLGLNFFDYVNQWRIEAAKPHIIANQSSVLDIALAAGFNARSSFYKAFKQQTGVTPSEFRKQHTKDCVDKSL